MRKITNRKLLNQAIHIESYIPKLIIIIKYNLIFLNPITGRAAALKKERRR